MQKRNFNRKGLINEIYKKMGFSKNFSSDFVDTFFENIFLEVKKNSKVKISSFGTFKILNKKERVGRNPKTKKEAIISPRKVLKFTPSSLFKKKIND
tara:strand:+ start:163 stop:453 length:291 start_codon:yes stop_codon:yes gene_type:complete